MLRITGWMLAAALVVSGCVTSDGEERQRVSSKSLESKTTATVYTADRRPADCISPISVYKIDDRNLVTGLQEFELPPGRHSLSGRAIITDSFCSKSGVASSGGRKDELKPLVYDFEAGKVYFVGVNHKASRASGWYIEVWEVQDK